MRMRLRFAAVALVALFTAPVAAADPSGSYFQITPVAGGTILSGDLRFPGSNSVADWWYFGGRIGYQFNDLLGVEAAGGYTPTTESVPAGREVDFAHFSGGVVVTPWGGRFGGPLVILGVGSSNLKAESVSDELRFTAYELGAGLRFWLSDMLGIRVEARHIAGKPGRENFPSPLMTHVMSAGLTVALGGRPRDTDSDGVPDRKDQSPNTPAGAVVDAAGAPKDSDGDAVFDGIDKCPDTPKGATVDATGCPSDADGDGVFDGLDECADTPKGATPDAKGCPRDADADSVYDGLDECPDTPKGAIVNDKGCPSDADGDGVPDGIDQCPGTVAGMKVDSAGCVAGAAELESQLTSTGRIIFADQIFPPGKSELLPEANPKLDVIGEVLLRWPQLKIEIGGHTDTQGSNAANLKLSTARAEAVRAYLTGRFPNLPGGMLTAKGYGESRPLVPDNTEANRARNRRVEFRVLNLDVLQKELERRKAPGN